MRKQQVIFDGSFDPFTLGHLYIVQEAIAMGFQPIVLLAENPSKKYEFKTEQRINFIKETLRESLGDNHDVLVEECHNQYVAQWAADHGVGYRIRGIRNPNDFLDEYNISQNNATTFGSLKTLFVIPPLHLSSLSSSFVKGIRGYVGWHWKIKQFVGRHVAKRIIINYITKKCVDAGCEPDHIAGLLQCYYEPNRKYHTINHLAHIISELERVRCFNRTVAYAVLGHDCVYNGMYDDVDESVDEVERILGCYYEPRIGELIKASDGHDVPDGEDHTIDLFLDADIAILGTSPEIYQEYAEAIGVEYSNVPYDEYLKGRIKFLEKMLSMDKIFRTPEFQIYEQRARDNMEREKFDLIMKVAI